jgi:hypothetical protein
MSNFEITKWHHIKVEVSFPAGDYCALTSIGSKPLCFGRTCEFFQVFNDFYHCGFINRILGRRDTGGILKDYRCPSLKLPEYNQETKKAGTGEKGQ